MKKNNDDKRFKRKYEKVKYNPIRTIDYPAEERTFLNHGVNSNVIGSDNDKILGMFCYDAPCSKESSHVKRLKK